MSEQDTASPAWISRLPRLVERLERALNYAYDGSAEHGSFLRNVNTEYVPSVFMTLDELKSVLADLVAACPPPSAAPATLLTIAGLVNGYHNDGTTLTAAETLRAIADVLGPPMEGETP